MNQTNPDQERLAKATRQRLARLGSIPVDTTRLEARLNKAFEAYQPAIPVSSSPAVHWWRPIYRIAAVFAVVGLIGLLFVSMGGNPAIASVTELVRIHQEAVAGESDLMPADNFTEAAGLIHDQWAKAPKIPEPRVGRVIASCLHELASREVACLKLELRGQPITMVVGHSREIVCSAEHHQISRNGRTYLVYDRDDVRMVMIDHDDRWVCIMGEAPMDDLIELADGLEF